MSMVICQECDRPIDSDNDPECFTDFDEVLCDNCRQNQAERAWERHQESYHDGGATSWRSLRDQQIEALKLK